MKQKKAAGLVLALALALSLLAGCGGETPEEPTEAQEPATTAADENQAAAEKLLQDLTGSYEELWPVILAEEYHQIWLDDCAELVGEDNAAASYEMLAGMVTGELYGQEAVEAYQDGNSAFFCGFTQDLSTLEVAGDTSTITGYDKDGQELFSHTYHYVETEADSGMAIFESDDADAGAFTYFAFAPDTPETTYHIEFRYGSNREDLGKYDSGEYAYWLASGIAADYDQTMVENCIQLFCTENLSE